MVWRQPRLKPPQILKIIFLKIYGVIRYQQKHTLNLIFLVVHNMFELEKLWPRSNDPLKKPQRNFENRLQVAKKENKLIKHLIFEHCAALCSRAASIALRMQIPSPRRNPLRRERERFVCGQQERSESCFLTSWKAPQEAQHRRISSCIITVWKSKATWISLRFGNLRFLWEPEPF